MDKVIVFTDPGTGAMAIIVPRYLDRARKTSRPGRAELDGGSYTFREAGNGTLHSLQVIADNLHFSDGERVFVETTTQMIDRITARHIPLGTQWWAVSVATIPNSGKKDHLRDAWECPGGVAGVNMPKARVIHMGRIRLVRNKELLGLDWQLSRAQETNNTAEEARIKTLKQTLRDIPATFDLNDHITATALKAAWPAELPAQEESE